MRPRPTGNSSTTPAGAPAPACDDLALIERARSGDEAAFETLVRGHFDVVWRLVFRLVGHDGHAERLVQQVFLDARAALPGFQGSPPFPTWLRRIAVERALQFVKPRRGRPNPARDEDERTTLESCIPSLVPSLRVPICLKLEGLTHDQIAETLDLPVGAVRTRLFLARDTLGKCARRKKAQHLA